MCELSAAARAACAALAAAAAAARGRLGPLHAAGRLAHGDSELALSAMDAVAAVAEATAHPVATQLAEGCECFERAHGGGGGGWVAALAGALTAAAATLADGGGVPLDEVLDALERAAEACRDATLALAVPLASLRVEDPLGSPEERGGFGSDRGHGALADARAAAHYVAASRDPHTAALVCAAAESAALGTGDPHEAVLDVLDATRVVALAGWPRRASSAIAGAAVPLRRARQLQLVRAQSTSGDARIIAGAHEDDEQSVCCRVAVLTCEVLGQAAESGAASCAREVSTASELADELAAGGAAAREEAFAKRFVERMVKLGVGLVLCLGKAHEGVTSACASEGITLVDGLPMADLEAAAAACGAVPSASPRLVRASRARARATLLVAPRRAGHLQGLGEDLEACGVLVVGRAECFSGEGEGSDPPTVGDPESVATLLMCAPTELGAREAAASAARSLAATRTSLGEGGIAPGAGALEMALAAELRHMAHVETANGACYRSECYRTFAACFEELVRVCLVRAGRTSEDALAALAAGCTAHDDWRCRRASAPSDSPAGCNPHAAELLCLGPLLGVWDDDAERTAHDGSRSEAKPLVGDVLRWRADGVLLAAALARRAVGCALAQ